MSFRNELHKALRELFNLFPPNTEDVLVIGCSTSEILGHKIGSSSNLEVAEEIFEAFWEAAEQERLQLAFQCCEHLNRAIVVDEKLYKSQGLKKVSVIPSLSAGGALATFAYRNIPNPHVVEAIQGDFGIDIGNALIGMHLKHVAVPVRVEQKKVGSASVVIARTRPPLIGGERASYPQDPGKL